MSTSTFPGSVPRSEALRERHETTAKDVFEMSSDEEVLIMDLLLCGAFYVGLLDGLLGVAGGCWDDD